MDEEIKKRFDAFCADAGMNAAVAVNPSRGPCCGGRRCLLRSPAMTTLFTA
jgi:hypothetical protein